ncbi:hypothetical protein N7532_000713 [Penicillium argentinense]|uniref:Uncharacterized protein n=1 Tax=Penicillium argentinense TaxID=1131581 RepID=A0A9W9G680_9EURO|nr:uncharacterized protein N7532_000713 [Penicillium argentinense]KAJ5112668.1 hypothetical protein N7532_000713 [Penicillium argentinense]
MDMEGFAKIPDRSARSCPLDGDWRCATNSCFPDAITGAIIDGCVDCLYSMEENGLLPGGVEGGDPEYNCTGYAMTSIAIASEILAMQADYKGADLVPYREILELFIGRQIDNKLGPMAPSTVDNRFNHGKPILQIARVFTETLALLTNRHEHCNPDVDDRISTMLQGNVGYELCRRADKAIVEWARRYGIELADAHVHADDEEEGTVWHALCQNPIGETLFDDFARRSKYHPGDAAGGRIPLYEAIKRDRVDMVEWFVRPAQRPQNVWDSQDPKRVYESPIDLALTHNTGQASTCLYLLIQSPDHLEYMKNRFGDADGANDAYRAGLVRKLIDHFHTSEAETREKAKAVNIEKSLVELEIRRLKQFTLLKLKALTSRASKNWRATAEAERCREMCEKEDSPAAYLLNFVTPGGPHWRFQRR